MPGLTMPVPVLAASAAVTKVPLPFRMRLEDVAAGIAHGDLARGRDLNQPRALVASVADHAG